MKKLLIFILTAALVVALCMAVLVAAEAAGTEERAGVGTGPYGVDEEELSERQEEVHAAAELLRELGVAEDDPAIKALQDEWWRCQKLKNAKYLGTYTVTGYDLWCAHCQGRWVGVTASGISPEVGRTVAMCDQFAFGTEIYIEGLGFYTVEDRGVGLGKIDVACDSHADCYALTGRYKVWVVNDG